MRDFRAVGAIEAPVRPTRPPAAPPAEPIEPPAETPGGRPPERPRRRGRPARRLGAAIAGLAGLAVIIGIVLRSFISPSPAPTPPVAGPSGTRTLTARGQVQPIQQAKIGTLNGGVVSQIDVSLGQTVERQQAIARTRNNGALEVLSAPWRGTITGLLVHAGDTVMPGTILVTMADLSQYQVETTDLDEFLIGTIFVGQSVVVTVDALDRREIEGTVRAVSLQPQTNRTGDEHYPVTISLGEIPTELRAGMTARVQFLAPPDRG